MPNVSKATLDAEKVVCPSCGAAPGRQCKSRVTGHVTVLHPSRIHRGAVGAERVRVRRELIDAVADQREEWALARPSGVEMVKSEREMGADAAFMVVMNALDRIIPEEG